MTQLAEDAPYALVVDDDFLIRMGMVDILENAGFQVLEADHGDAAYALMEVRHQDVVLLFSDVQMPGKLDGFALARAVAASWPHVSIVVASGHAKPGPESMPEKARFIGKPFNTRIVHNHLREILPDGQKPTPLKAAAANL
ncbi:MAG: response regulator [Janthinobacterium lividum]